MDACGGDGVVGRDVVLQVLKFNGVSVAVDGNNCTFSRDDLVEVIPLPPEVHRHMLHRLSRRYGIPIHLFYHPEVMVPASSPGTSPTVQ